MKTKKAFAFLAIMALVIMPMFVFAAVDPTKNPIGSLDPQTGIPVFSATSGKFVDDPAALIVNLVNWFAWFVAVVAVVTGLYAGFLFITAHGETAQLSTARKTFMYAMIGVTVAIVSFSIIAIIKTFL